MLFLFQSALLNALSGHDKVLRVQHLLQDKEAVHGVEREAVKDEISRFCRPTPAGVGPCTGLFCLICDSILGKEEIAALHSVTAQGKEGSSKGNKENLNNREGQSDSTPLDKYYFT